jgi:hypothetical protein
MVSFLKGNKTKITTKSTNANVTKTVNNIMNNNKNKVKLSELRNTNIGKIKSNITQVASNIKNASSNITQATSNIAEISNKTTSNKISKASIDIPKSSGIEKKDIVLSKLKKKVVYAILLATLCIIGLVIIYQKINVYDKLLRTFEGKTGPSGAIGSQGIQGPSGRQGEAGGVFTHQGALMNLGTDGHLSEHNILSRTAVNNNQSSGYLDKRNYDTIQHWTLLNSGQLENKYGDGTGQSRYCLELGDDDNVLLRTCSNEQTVVPAQKWEWKSDGSIRNNQHPSKCMSISSNTINIGEHNLSKIKLTSCDRNNNNPKNKWMFI